MCEAAVFSLSQVCFFSDKQTSNINPAWMTYLLYVPYDLAWPGTRDIRSMDYLPHEVQCSRLWKYREPCQVVGYHTTT